MSFNTIPFNPFPPSSDQQGGGGGGGYVLPVASDDTLGGIKVGDNLTVEEDGTLNAPDPYELPIAADDTLGGIKVGDNLTIEEDGTLNAPDPYTPPNYSITEYETGKKWIDGRSIYARVLNITETITITSEWTATGLSDNSIDFITNGTVIRKTANGPIPCDFNVENGSVRVSYRSSITCTGGIFVIIEYVKVATP